MAKVRKSSNFPKHLLIATVFSIIVILILIYTSRLYLNKNQNKTLIENEVELGIHVCDPENGPFSTEIDNPYFPLTVGDVKVYKSDTETVNISVLDEIEIVAGVETRVVEETEWEDNELAEISRNFFVQAPDGTVCYYGEDVDDYEDDEIVGHDGAWRAGEGGE